MMSSKDAHLYNPRPANLRNGREISSSNSASFTSTLSSLINAAPSNRTSKPKPTSARLQPKKEDLFQKPNRHTAKRAKLDLDPRTQTEEGERLDGEIWERSRRKMEEKTRLYKAMKRGDLEDVEERYAVDFERKWAEGHPDEEGPSDAEEKVDAGKDSDSEEEEEVEYIDEFGRTRRGPASLARRTKRIAAARADLESDTYTSRPAAPAENLIRGDTIQHGAWQPDNVIAEQMSVLAGKRDRSLTPPPEEHFDGRWEEGRQKGTGWFRFSRDEEERKAQMDGLEELREETVKARAERERERGESAADQFLDELGVELGREKEGRVEEDRTSTNSKSDK